MISQQTICGDNEGLNLNNNMESSKEQTKLERMQNNLKKAREFYFKYFLSQRMACTKANHLEKGNDGHASNVPITLQRGYHKENW